jgi:predicted transcriptional regulator
MVDGATETNTLELATELTVAWLYNPNTRASADEVPAFLAKMHSAVKDLSAPAPMTATTTTEEQPAEEFTPAVTVCKSLASKDHIVSLRDGKPYKTLKRHLSGHGLTPDQYRERYSLKSDYQWWRKIIHRPAATWPRLRPRPQTWPEGSHGETRQAACSQAARFNGANCLTTLELLLPPVVNE